MFAMFLAAAAGLAQPHFAAKPCTQPNLPAKARCGTVLVPEARSGSGRRTIALNIVILPATRRAISPPLFDLEGGPGLASTKNAAFYGGDGAAYRVNRDIVMIDQRGTGGSNPLRCEELAAPEPAYREMFADAAVERCRRSLAARADLRRYGTDDAVADLDAVRAALAHPRIDLIALSYGTTVALRYLALHGERVRAAVLTAPVPARAMPPSGHAVAAQRALDLLFAECAADPACNLAFKPKSDLATALSRLPAIAGAPPRDRFLESLRSLMYSAEGARKIPFILHRAATGDLAPFFASTRPTAPSPFADGAYLSVTCAESFKAMDYPAAARAARATMFGDYRLSRQKSACARWPVATVAADFYRPVAASAAVLLLTGTLDPVAPPEWADEVAATLPHSRVVRIPSSGHVIDGMSAIDSCFDPLIVRFLDNADVQGLDTICIATMRPPAFAVGD